MPISSTSPVVCLRDLEYRYPKGDTLRFSDLEIRSGQHMLILGDSGSGKTTLLHLLCGLLTPPKGHVIIADQDIYQLAAKQLDRFRGQHIGLIFQDAHLIKSLTVRENLQIAQGFAGAPVDHGRIREVLDILDLAHKENSYPPQLSRGQVQRAAIARAVINRPAILVADEPTASLDDRNTASVIDLLLQQADRHGATLIIATHDKRVKSRISATYSVNAKPPAPTV